jgi:hypothetical protein
MASLLATAMQRSVSGNLESSQAARLPPQKTPLDEMALPTNYNSISQDVGLRPIKLPVHGCRSWDYN